MNSLQNQINKSILESKAHSARIRSNCHIYDLKQKREIQSLQDHDNGEPLSTLERIIYFICVVGYFYMVGSVIHYILVSYGVL